MSDETLVIDDDDRYARFRLIAWWDQEKLAAAKVLVVGAGALGNEVLKNLALLGVGTIYVVDFDRIETSNLTRSVLFRARDCGRPKAEVAAEALRDINPDTRVMPLLANIMTEVGLGLFRDVDVVIGCLDNREARLWVNRCCWKVNTPWIDGGIQEINGVVKVFVPPDWACYECAMTENDYRLINLRYSCPLLRQEDMLAGKVPTAPTISSMIAGLQTQEALKLIHGMPGRRRAGDGLQRRGQPVLQDGLSATRRLPQSRDLPRAGRTAAFGAEGERGNTAAELFAAVRTHLGGDEQAVARTWIAIWSSRWRRLTAARSGSCGRCRRWASTWPKTRSPANCGDRTSNTGSKRGRNWPANAGRPGHPALRHRARHVRLAGSLLPARRGPGDRMRDDDGTRHPIRRGRTGGSADGACGPIATGTLPSPSAAVRTTRTCRSSSTST